MNDDNNAFVGIDASLRSTGLVWFKEGYCPQGSLVVPPTKLGDYSLEYIDRHFNEWLDHWTDIKMAAIEGPSINSVNKPFEMGAAYGIYKLGLQKRKIPYTIVPPKSLKKYFAGSGSADKAAMAAAQPDAHPGKFCFDQNDLVDAYALSLLAKDVWHGTASIRKRSKEEVVQQALSTIVSYAAK